MSFKKTLQFSFLGLIGIMVLGLGVASTYFILKWNHNGAPHFAESKPVESKEVENNAREVTAKPEVSYPFEMKNLTLSLTNRKGNRSAYAQLSILLDCADPDCLKNLEMHRALVLDVLNSTARKYHIEDLQGGAGLTQFKAVVLQALNEKLDGSKPNTVMIRDWLVQ